MSDPWNQPTGPHQPPAPEPADDQQPTSPPTSDAHVASTSPGAAEESVWVRSVYLFGACATGGVMMIVGLLFAVGSLVSIISPDSGLRDGWDRGLVGATQVADDGLDVFADFTRSQRQDEFDRLCDGATDDPFCDDLEAQIDDEQAVLPSEVADSIGLIRDEVHRQIRVAAIARLAAGLVLAVIGFLLFRFHSKQVSVYRRS